MADEVTLLCSWVSSYSMRVKIALAEKGIEYQTTEEDLRSSKSSLLLKMNPIHKKIPVLIHHGKPICESLIIVEYIDEVWNHKPPLLPSDPYKRANARFWADYAAKKIYPANRLVWLSDGAAQEEAKKALIGCFLLLEGELGEKEYFGDDSFGLVDIALIPFYSWFYVLNKFGLDMAKECPKLVAWGKRCMQRESVAKALPEGQKLFDFILEYKQQLQ